MSDKFEFIDVEYAAYQESGGQYVPSIVKMCRWIEVSRSGFYAWRNAPESATAKRRGILALYVKKSFGDSDDTYGYRRVHADLVAWGVPAGPELVRSLMRELGLEPCQPRPWRVSLTEGDGQEHDIPDLVQRDFTADAPGEKMVGDISCIPTWQGWLYLATVIDCHTKEVIGWATDDNYKTPLINKAIEMAARNYSLAGNAIPLSAVGDPRRATHIPVRVIEYTVTDSTGKRGPEVFRLITTILDPEDVTAAELAAAYQQRWEYEIALKEIETQMLEPGGGLRSKSPELIRQELWALLLAHYAIRSLMSEAAASAGLDPDRLSFLRSINVVRRQVTGQAAFSPQTAQQRNSDDHRGNPPESQ